MKPNCLKHSVTNYFLPSIHSQFCPVHCFPFSVPSLPHTFMALVRWPNMSLPSSRQREGSWARLGHRHTSALTNVMDPVALEFIRVSWVFPVIASPLPKSTLLISCFVFSFLFVSFYTISELKSKQYNRAACPIQTTTQAKSNPLLLSLTVSPQWHLPGDISCAKATHFTILSK